MQAPDPEVARLNEAAAAAYLRRDITVARQLAEQVLQRSPSNAQALEILGLADLERGAPQSAKSYFERAIESAPKAFHLLNSLGVALRRTGETDAARAMFTHAGEGGQIDGWRNLGNLEIDTRHNDAAIAAYQRALKMAPDNPAFHAGLARGYEAIHDLAKAKTHIEAALRGDPNSEVARIVLVEVLMREKDFAGAEAAAEPLTAGIRTNSAIAWGLIGDSRDRRDNPHGAFEAYAKANEILLGQNKALFDATDEIYDLDSVVRMSARVESANFAWPAKAVTATPTPAFLVGFPRSGTTLLDQILSSHSKVICLEERNHLADAFAPLLNDPAKLDRLDQVADREIEAIRVDYWDRLRKTDAVDGKAVVVDKLPLNIVLLPLIKRVFLDAKIIYALRDPRDVVLSCYVQRFAVSAAMAQFLDLDRAAAYYDAVMHLMTLCREKLALNIHAVRYEDVVANLEREARRAAEFLGLQFEPRMLAFRETALKRGIATPSARQVIEPLYDSAVGKWRRYATELAPVLPTLNVWAERLGYPR